MRCSSDQELSFEYSQNFILPVEADPSIIQESQEDADQSDSDTLPSVSFCSKPAETVAANRPSMMIIVKTNSVHCQVNFLITRDDDFFSVRYVNNNVCEVKKQTDICSKKIF